jgi:hypothetical protein
MHGSERVMFMNEMAEVHGNTLDFLGPFEIDGSGRMLFVKIRSAGIALDVAVTTRAAGDAWRRQYLSQRGVPLPPGPPIVAGVVPPDVETDRSIALPQGQYYLVVDNSPYVGQTAPPASVLFDPVARVAISSRWEMRPSNATSVRARDTTRGAGRAAGAAAVELGIAAPASWRIHTRVARPPYSAPVRALSILLFRTPLLCADRMGGGQDSTQ